MELYPMIDFALGSFDASGLEPETVLPEQFFRRYNIDSLNLSAQLVIDSSPADSTGFQRLPGWHMDAGLSALRHCPPRFAR